MRISSTPQSTLAGEVTVLAIVETIAATTFSIWLVVHRGTLTHVVVGACVAPFLLLRTDESTRFAMSWAERLQAFVDRELARGTPREMFAVLLALFTYPLIRPCSLVLTALRRPLLSIRGIPRNWIRMVLTTDLLHPPEILPEIESKYSEVLPHVPVIRFTTFLAYERQALFPPDKKIDWSLVIVAAISSLVIGAFWYVPALAYRYSLKATALIYLPIIWVLHDSLVEASSFQHKLEDIKESQIERLKRWYSSFVLVFLVVVPAIVYVVQHEWWQKTANWIQEAHPALVALLSAFLPATPSGLEIRGWHLARGANATLTILLFIWADGKLRQIARGTSQKTEPAVARLNLWLLVRGLLTLYIIGCTLYIVAAAMNWKSLWPVHFRWFPWS